MPLVTDPFTGVCVLATARHQGDLALGADPAAVAARAHALVDLPWVWLRQVHGAGVVEVRSATAARWCGTEGDALVTSDPDLVVAVRAADCAPVAFASPEGVIGVAHAGWRGLAAGVIEATVAAMRRAGASVVAARLGPCIGVECYEFGLPELDVLAARFGDGVRGRTAWGTPALDLPAAVAAACRAAGVTGDVAAPPCTACDPERWFSHRARAEAGRMALAVWRPAERA